MCSVDWVSRCSVGPRCSPDRARRARRVGRHRARFGAWWRRDVHARGSSRARRDGTRRRPRLGVHAAIRRGARTSGVADPPDPAQRIAAIVGPTVRLGDARRGALRRLHAPARRAAEAGRARRHRSVVSSSSRALSAGGARPAELPRSPPSAIQPRRVHHQRVLPPRSDRELRSRPRSCPRRAVTTWT
jgi:hypothetical protein